jgi:hypothetical protein
MKKDIINKTYYMYVDTSTIIGKLEQKVSDILSINTYKLGKNGRFLNSNNNHPYGNDDYVIKVKWRYSKCNKNALYYDFYLKFFNKYINLGKLRYDKLYIDKHSNIHGKGFIFN